MMRRKNGNKHYFKIPRGFLWLQLCFPAHEARMGTRKKVHAFVRVKPTDDFAHEMIKYGDDNKSIDIHLKKDLQRGVVNNKQTDWSFKLDGVLHNASQDLVYETVAKDVVAQALDGYNGRDQQDYRLPHNEQKLIPVTLHFHHLRGVGGPRAEGSHLHQQVAIIPGAGHHCPRGPEAGPHPLPAMQAHPRPEGLIRGKLQYGPLDEHLWRSCPVRRDGPF
uniref:kinesin-like protein KIF9 isoform X11 n=1 Tax=Halichoerus grypus TaxID=9711 RepID=UPI001659F1BA|nr:kinesin-like protein KIF9 isoform X11 [Halichoerus grypus]